MGRYLAFDAGATLLVLAAAAVVGYLAVLWWPSTNGKRPNVEAGKSDHHHT